MSDFDEWWSSYNFNPNDYYKMQTAFAAGFVAGRASVEKIEVKAEYTTGHCANHAVKGGCQLPNVQCGYPECDRKKIEAAPSQEPDWITKLRHELMMAKITHNFTFSRDEVFELLNGKTAPSQEPVYWMGPNTLGMPEGTPLYQVPPDAAAQIAEKDITIRTLSNQLKRFNEQIAKLTDELAGVWIELKNERRKK